MGIHDFEEPFTNLLTQGMVCKETMTCPEHGWLLPEEVESGKCSHCGSKVEHGRVEKMSKSKKNVIDPEHLIQSYGADTSRLFSLFAAPPEKDLEWSDKGVEGSFRFLNRLWTAVYNAREKIKNISDNVDKDSPLFRKAQQTIKKVTNDIEREFHFNTAIASMMELLNDIYAFKAVSGKDYAALGFALHNLILLIAPFSPHIAEELWEAIGNKPSVFRQFWPDWDEEYAKDNEIELVVQINGKVRAKSMVPAGLPDGELKEIALGDRKVRDFMGDKEIRKVIVVKGKLVNIVI
jgi:leucyl-tRNA synthetase